MPGSDEHPAEGGSSGARDLVREWQAAMRSLVSSATSAAARPLPDQVLASMQRQLELIQEVLERERRFQGEVLSRMFTPLNNAFDLLEQSAAAVRQQAKALSESAKALERAADMMEVQADLFERTIQTLREPAEVAKDVAGVKRRPSEGARP